MQVQGTKSISNYIVYFGSISKKCLTIEYIDRFLEISFC